MISITLKNPLDSLCRVAALSSNIRAGLLSTILISGDFLKDPLFEFAGNFNL
jgi:hypothetical protein